jgi:hypothetical protein
MARRTPDLPRDGARSDDTALTDRAGDDDATLRDRAGRADPALRDRAGRADPALRDRARGSGPGSLRRRRNGDGRAARVAEAASAARARQREEFGGVSWLSALVGWLAAAGLTAILSGILGAAGAVLAVTDVGRDVAGSDAQTIGLAGAIALLVVLAIAYWFGGWAAGRMARFDGARQGIAVWVWGVLAAGVFALLTLIGGADYNVLDRLNLPRVPIDSGTLTTAGLLVLLSSIAVTLFAAMLGGKAGERFHRKVDRAGVID